MLLQDKRIFIVEDDASNRLIMQILLESQGAKVIFERLRSQTVARLKDRLPIDIILLDLMFPDGTTGYDIFDQIHPMEEFRSIPIVVVSAADATTEVPKARIKGLSSYLMKPVDPNKFPQQILSIIKGEEIWQVR